MLDLVERSRRVPRRVRNELRFRPVEVRSKTLIADHFYRIEFCGEALEGFTSSGFDDHIKVFFPDPLTGELHLPEITEDGVVWKEGIKPVARDYTPLFFDGEKGRLTLDFYRHDGGVASGWAVNAQPGDTLVIGGPRASLVVPNDYDFQLYFCDETGLPAFKRRLQTLTGSRIMLFAWVDETAGKSYLPEMDNVDVTWLGSGNMTAGSLPALFATLDKLALPDEDYFIWLTGEGVSVKCLSDYFIQQRKREPDWVRAVAYWHHK